MELAMSSSGAWQAAAPSKQLAAPGKSTSSSSGAEQAAESLPINQEQRPAINQQQQRLASDQRHRLAMSSSGGAWQATSSRSSGSSA
jgi:hypothetical protein